jgi:hypothetical protein
MLAENSKESLQQVIRTSVFESRFFAHKNFMLSENACAHDVTHLKVGRGGGLVKSDSDGLGVQLAKVDLVLDGGLADSRSVANFDLCVHSPKEIQKCCGFVRRHYWREYAHTGCMRLQYACMSSIWQKVTLMVRKKILSGAFFGSS